MKQQLSITVLGLIFALAAMHLTYGINWYLFAFMTVVCAALIGVVNIDDKGNDYEH